MSKKSVKFKGEKAVKLENYLHAGNMDVSRELHNEIEPAIPEEKFIVKLYQYDGFVNYEYANLGNNLDWEHNWSQERTIDGFETIEEIEDALVEISFK